jgi:hypothetical protein
VQGGENATGEPSTLESDAWEWDGNTSDNWAQISAGATIPLENFTFSYDNHLGLAIAFSAASLFELQRRSCAVVLRHGLRPLAQESHAAR